jgi:hypothetical protein
MISWSFASSNGSDVSGVCGSLPRAVFGSCAIARAPSTGLRSAPFVGYVVLHTLTRVGLGTPSPE